MGILVLGKSNRVEEYPIHKIDFALFDNAGDVEVYIEGEMKKLKDKDDIKVLDRHLGYRVISREGALLFVSLSPEEIREELLKRRLIL